MSDKDKALAIFRSEVTFQQADAPPQEYLQREDAVLDPIKLFNVYGYTLCSVSSANVVCLARYVGLPARCFAIDHHVVPEIFYDNAWHMLDADLIEYFPKANGSIASLQEIVDGIGKWKAEHPEYDAINKNNRYAYMANPGWKSGPDILRRNPFYDANGWLPCAEFAWGDTMSQFGRIDNAWQPCFSLGYRVNVQPREGEKLTRNWFNKGLHINMDGGEAPGSLNAKIGEGSFRHSRKWGDLAPGRVGNGTLEYDVPLASGAFRGGALKASNLVTASDDASGPACTQGIGQPGQPRNPHAFQLCLSQRTIELHARRRRRRRDRRIAVRQQWSRLEGSGHRTTFRRPKHRPQAANFSPLRLHRDS